MWRVEEPKKEIKEHERRGPYVLEEAGVQAKYADEREKIVIAYNRLTSRGESVVVPSMAVDLTPGGDASAYAPMGLGDSPEDEEEQEKPRTDLPYMPHAPGVGSAVESELGQLEEADEEKRRRDAAVYFRAYRRMRRFGFRWAKSEYDWIKENLTDYNLGWTNGYSGRRSTFRDTRFARRRDSYIFRRELGIRGRKRATHVDARRGNDAARKRVL